MPKTGSTKLIRRIQEACHTCRRKKRKCPGERPTCSLCDRLGQDCVYQETPHGGRWPRSRRVTNQHIQDAEITVPESSREPEDDLPRQLSLSAQQVESAQPPINPQAYIAREDFPHEPQNHNSSTDDAEIRSRCIKFYFDFLHNRPYPLFVDSGFQDGAETPTEVLAAIVALTYIPAMAQMGTTSSQQQSESFLKTAWTNLLTLYTEIAPDKLPLSFLQGVCLMIQADLAHGNIARAQTQLALGLSIVQIQGFTSSRFAGLSNSRFEEECKRCTWSLFMLDRVTSASFNSTSPTHHRRFHLAVPLPLNRSSIARQSDKVQLTLQTLDCREDETSGALLPILIFCFLIWGEVVEYVFKEAGDDGILPWDPKSQFAKIEARLLEFELAFNPSHRYVSARFPSKAANDPTSRTYFSTWLCSQILLHAAVCLLHHPFNIYRQLHSKSKHVPPTFLQKSFETSMIHSRWVLRLVREMHQVQLALRDPFYVYLVSIAASIQLEHTRSKSPEKAAAARQDFETALDHAHRMSAAWPRAEDASKILLALAARFENRQTIAHGLQNYDGAIHTSTAEDFERLSIEEEDVSLLRNLLTYARAPIITNTPPTYDKQSSLPNEALPEDITTSVPDFSEPGADGWSFLGEPWTAFVNNDFLSPWL